MSILSRKASMMLLVVLLVMGTMVAAAEASSNTTEVVIDGKTSDRVHLREFSSADANSLGLYFTGTSVICESDMSAEWVAVTVGMQSGYMKSEFLTTRSVASKQPIGTVYNQSGSNWINLRYEPSLQAGVIGKYTNGDTVIVLGETATYWYYVHVGGQYGYMLAEHVKIGDASSSTLPLAKPTGTAVPIASSSQPYEILVYTTAPNRNSRVNIQYPKFNGSNFDTVNSMILSKVLSLAQLDLSAYADGTSVEIHLQTAVTLNNSQMVSIVFWGSSNVQGSAHPTTNLFTLNIDLSLMREMTFSDLYNTGSGFETVFYQKAFFPSYPTTSYDAMNFQEMLALQMPGNLTASPFAVAGSVSCFLKPDGIVLSMPAIHATGSDHFEAQIQYGDIQQFYRARTKYWEH